MTELVRLAALTVMRAGLVVLLIAAGCGDSFQGPCGNGALDPFEECDDGNIESGDLCSANCTREPSCGDRIIDSPVENCDDGNSVPGDNCDENCRVETVCGDLHIEPGEMCEDGNADPSDGCSETCTIEYRVTSRVKWPFVMAATTGTDRGCPAGFDTVEVTTQAMRDDGSLLREPVIESFPCADGMHESKRFQGRYHVRVRVTDSTGVPTYATALETTVDLRSAQRDVLAQFIIDGGVAQVAWEMIDPATGEPHSCAEAGADTMGVLASSPTFVRAHYAPCTAQQATTQALEAGDYTLTLSAIEDGGFGTELASTSVPITITAPCGVVTVGTLAFEL